MIQEVDGELRLSGSTAGEMHVDADLDSDGDLSIQVTANSDRRGYQLAWILLGPAERRALIEHLKRVTPQC